jgi:PAS domain S-box-containing protein/putative nucleotidyltransferase with HDIG domain
MSNPEGRRRATQGIAPGHREGSTRLEKTTQAPNGFLHELEQAQGRLLALGRTAAGVQSQLDPDRVLETIGDELREQGLRCFFAFLDDEGERLTLRQHNLSDDQVCAVRDITGRHLESFECRVDSSPLLQAVLVESNAIFENDLQQRIREVLPRPVKELARGVTELLGVEKAIAAPLVVGTAPLGLVVVCADRLTEADVPLISVLAQQAAAAIERAALYSDAMQSVFEMEALRMTTLDMTKQLDLPRLLRLIVERAAALIGTRGGGLYLYDQNRNELEFVVSLNLGKDYTGVRLLAGEGLSGRVVQTGQPLAIEDYSQWEDRSPKFDGTNFGGVLAVPLKWGDRTTGVLNVTDGSGPRSFKDRDLWLLEWFANSAAVAIENARAFADRERKIEQLAALHEVSLEVLAETDSSPLLLAIVQKATELLKADAGAIDLLDRDSGALEMAISHGYQRDYTHIHLAPGEGVAGMVCETSQPLSVDDYRRWPGRVPQIDEAEIGSALGVPLLRGRRLIGVLTIDRRDHRPFDQEDIQLATLFANQAAIALQNAQTVEATRKRVAELTALRDISLQLGRSLDLENVLDTIAHSAVTLVGADDAHIFLYNQDDGSFTFGSGAWARAKKREPYTQVRRNGLTATVARLGEPVVINQVRDHPLFEKEDYPDDMMEAIAGFPLQRGGTILGVFNVAFMEPHTFDEDELRVLTLLADQAATAIDNARLHQETERRLRESQTLGEVSRLVNSTLEPGQIFQTVVEKLASAFSYSMASIYTMEKDGLHLVAQVGYDPERSLSFMPLDWGIMGRVARTGQAEFVRDVSADPEFIAAADEVVSEIAVPMRRNREVLGVLNVESVADSPLTDADLPLLTSLAHQVSIAIENARLYQGAQRELAERKRAEEEYRSVVEHSLQGLLVMQDGRVVFANQAMAGIAGYTVEELQSLSPEQVTTLVHPEDQDLVWDRLRERLAGKEVPPHYEYRALRKDGSVIWVEMFANTVEYRGQPAVQAALLDITERVWAQEALQESEERYRTLFEDSRDAVYITTRDGRFVNVNESFLSLFGVSRDELAGLRPGDLYERPEDCVSFQREIEDKGSVRDYGTRLRRKDGAIIDALCSATVWRDQEGAILGYRGFIHDITQRKRAEEELQRSYLDLRETLEGTVSALAALAEARDPYTSGHQQRVAALACAIAEEMGLSADAVQAIRMAGLVHDIGKIHVPAEILSKPTKLTDIEMQLIRTHPQTAYEILRTVKFNQPVGEIVLQHHERMNGSGYPNGLAGDDISLEARVLAVADVVEAMASNRPYRPAYGIDEALAEISQNAGVLYDEQVAHSCLTLFREKGLDLRSAQTDT